MKSSAETSFKSARRLSLQGILLAPLLTCLMLIMPLASHADETRINSTIHQIKQDHGVSVIHRYDREAIFPDSWLAPPISASG